MNKVDLKIVSAHLGHGDISTTADIYADVLRSAHQEVAQLIEFYLDNDEKTDLTFIIFLFKRIDKNCKFYIYMS